MDLALGQVITHGCVTEIPISNMIMVVKRWDINKASKKVKNFQIDMEPLLQIMLG